MSYNVFAAHISVACFLVGTFVHAEQFTLTSPSKDNTIKLSVGEQLTYEIEFQGKTVLAPSQMGLQFQGEAPYGAFEVVNSKTETVNQTWDNPLGRKRTYVDNFSALMLYLREREKPSRTLGIECRAFDDGVAFRYVLDEKSVVAKTYVLERDCTQFNFPGDPYGWFSDYGNYRSAYEQYYLKNRLSSIETGAHVGCPLVVQSGSNGPYLAFSESDLRHWGGMYFESQPIREHKTQFETGTMRKGDDAKTFKIAMEGIQLFSLNCNDNGDGIAFDHVDWVDLQLVDKNGKATELTTLTPITVTQGYGATNTNKNIVGGTLSIGGKTFEKGFGTHANGKIMFQLDKEYAYLQGAVGHDDGAGQSGSIRAWIQTLPKVESVKLQAHLSPRRDKNGVAKATVPGTSPWRVVIIAPEAIQLGDNSIILNLAEQADPTVDWSWVKPGIAPCDWLADCGKNQSTESINAYTQFCAEMGWEYLIVDDPWYYGRRKEAGVSHVDITRGNTRVDLKNVTDFAREKNVKLILWLVWSDLDKQVDEAFPLYEKLGVAGVKVDFMNRDDQEMVEWYETITKKAAKHHLFVDYHGAFKPTGLNRTYPNQIAREAIMANEHNIWSRLSPDHYCTLPFTRMILGAGDFTPGAFLNRHYKDDNITGYQSYQVVGTRAHELCLTFIYDSPLLCIGDCPVVYRAETDGLDFIKSVPTVWDDSKNIEGEIGEYFSMIRRKGSDWYYGAITNGTPRTLKLPLTFLGEGTYEATIYADTPETEIDARKISITKRDVCVDDTLDIKMGTEGGQAIVFRKK